MIGIYKITNKINGKSYIGQSQDIERRWKDHQKNSTSDKQILYRAFNKYGIDNFLFEVVEECSIQELNDKEIYYIELFRTFGEGYNMNEGGGGSRGVPLSEETKNKISQSLTGKTHSEETKAKMSYSKKDMKRKPLTKEQKGQISDSLKRYHANNEHACLGREVSDETREKISVANKGKKSRSKKVYCDGMIFNSGKDCAEYYDIKYTTMSCWLSGNSSMRKDFLEKGLKYL